MDMETINSDGAFFDKWQWNHEDELILIPYFDRLVKKRIFSDYFFLPEDAFKPDDIDGVFRQAEKDGAEAILSIRSISFVDWYYNPAGILDLTLIGTFWIPGSKRGCNLCAGVRIEVLVAQIGQGLIQLLFRRVDLPEGLDLVLDLHGLGT